ncbi:hypothetical protein AVEN_34374-1 [Araneus ventricosus]|uniref:Uncharacterized protein n=1 Tax=Araneus ventricosus TaxID=182803 RepID=A0A4Y2G489_ARAVE|nr:hypothetical protein AVEN_34374-1 [Araneus ventricosus]
MLKLVRNCLASKGSLHDGKNLVNWKYITELEKLQREEGLHAATKPRLRHVQWYREKMKVKLAAQVLSRSVADALEYALHHLKHPKFEGGDLKFLFTYKLSQDHLELFFSAIRSHNPTAKQFKAAYVRLLTHHQMTSNSANCTILDGTNILNVGASKNTYLKSINDSDAQRDDIDQWSAVESLVQDHNYCVNAFRHQSQYSQDVIGYVPGFVVKKLKTSLCCVDCISAVVEKSKSPSNLLLIKNRGGLNLPSDDITNLLALLDIEVYEATGTVCADTGASQSVGGESMSNFLQKRGQKFIEIDLAVCLADGQQATSTVLKTTVPITVHGRTFRTDLIFLPHAKGNCTLLGVDFLRKSGIAMDMHNNLWSSCPTNSITSDDPVQSNPVVPETNNLCLRVEEGQNLDTENKNRLTALLIENEEIFRQRGEPTSYVKHYINTGDHPPVASTPYRLSPKKKELLRTEIDKLLANDVIEECESPYAAPVVLVPKPNRDIRLCIDYPTRKRKHYLGDFDDDMNSPTKACKLLSIAQSQQKIINAERKTKSLEKKLFTLKEMLSDLKKKRLATEPADNIFKTMFYGPALEILLRASGLKKGKYAPELRSFALTLHFYFKKAYVFRRGWRTNNCRRVLTRYIISPSDTEEELISASES